ncbi:MAG: hypothetical protein RL660_1266 [Bacteroidota bacterium]|jgi:hypothetical protein
MPIVSSSTQNSKTLEEYYEDLTSENSTLIENKIGVAMLEFIGMVNDTFKHSTLFGLTSRNRLLIQPADDFEDAWFVAVDSLGDNKFQFAYKMSESESPWSNASVTGLANSVNEARDFLIIAMKESYGWSDNKELQRLYSKIKVRKTENTQFKLWLEFEEVDPNTWNIDNDFCNISVDLEDGRHYGLNIWTYNYLETAIREDSKTGQNLAGLYQTPPDLFVKELTRECIQKTIEDLLKLGDLEKVLNPSVYDKRYQK